LCGGGGRRIRIRRQLEETDIRTSNLKWVELGIHSKMIVQNLSNFVARCPELKLIITVLVLSLYEL
jgi:hypothetical protein